MLSHIGQGIKSHFEGESSKKKKGWTRRSSHKPKMSCQGFRDIRSVSPFVSLHVRSVSFDKVSLVGIAFIMYIPIRALLGKALL